MNRNPICSRCCQDVLETDRLEGALGYRTDRLFWDILMYNLETPIKRSSVKRESPRGEPASLTYWQI